MKRQIQKEAYQPANAEKDIQLINQFTRKELTPEEVYVFSVVLCDNEVDRDLERFTEKSLVGLAKLFEGRAGIFDHNWSAKNQAARLYKTAVEETEETTKADVGRKVLRGWAYMVRTPENPGLIAEIEGGIKKEVSVGCQMGKATCSICGADRSGRENCGHRKGKTYDGALCFDNLENPMDAYEWSFVAVPAQVGAGVTKGADVLKADRALDLLLSGGLIHCADRLPELEAALKATRQDGAETGRRQEIIAENTALQAVFTKKED